MRQKGCWLDQQICMRCGHQFDVIRRSRLRWRPPLVCGNCVAGWARKSRQRRRADRLDAQIDRHCDVCQEPMPDGRADRRQCSPACRQKAYRRRQAGRRAAL
jgi:hypothetical protein